MKGFMLAHIVAVASVCSTAFAGGGEIYTYVDADGVMHFTNVPSGEIKYRRLGWRTPQRSKAPKNTAKGTAARTVPEKYQEHVKEAERLYRVPAELVKAVMAVESSYNERAVSRAGAQGLMQLMPDTCEMLNIADPFEPRQNILAGARYLKMLLDALGQDLELALAAYNAGLNRVTKNMSVPAIAETRDYVRRVLSLYQAFLTEGAP